jgi:hypothetical protein
VGAFRFAGEITRFFEKNLMNQSAR